QRTARLLQCNRHRPSGKAGGQLYGPVFDGFRRVLELADFALCAAGDLQNPGMLAVCPVDGDKGGVIRLCGRDRFRHHSSPLQSDECCSAGAPVPMRSAYSRVWSQTRSEYSLKAELRQPDTLKPVIA